MIKVLRIIARLNVGGPARHCYLLGPRLRARGFETVLATGEVDRGEAEMVPGDCGVAAAEVTIARVPGLGRRISPRDDVRALTSLVDLIERERPHVVHTHTAKAGALGRIAASIAGVPAVVHTFHGHVLSGYFGPVGSWLAAMAERSLALLSDRLVTLSPSLRDELSSRFRIAPRKRFAVVPLGHDLSRYESPPRGALRRELGVAAGTPLLLFLGRLVPIKAPGLLLEGLALARGRASEARLVIAGDGPLQDELRTRAASLGIAGRVHLVGWRSDLAALLGDADLLVMSSRNEGTPLSIVESFAAGVPVVATSVGGIPDMLAIAGGAALDAAVRTAASDGVDLRAEGALVASGDARALGRAIELFVERDDLRARAREAARAAARRYDVERLADDLAALYRALLARSNRGRLALAGRRRLGKPPWLPSGVRTTRPSPIAAAPGARTRAPASEGAA